MNEIKSESEWKWEKVYNGTNLSSHKTLYGHKLKLSRDKSFLLKSLYNLYRQAVIINFIYFVQINICFDYNDNYNDDYNDNDKGDDAIKKPQRGFST